MVEISDDVRALYEGGGFHSWLNLSFDRAEEGVAVFSVPHDDEYTGVGEATAVHGGVIATLMDVAGGAAIRTTHDDPEQWIQVTTNLNAAYLKPATDDIRAIATVVHAGSSTGVATVEVQREPDDVTVATGIVTCRLFRDRD